MNAATSAPERSALESRYMAAVTDAGTRGADGQFSALEKASLKSRAVCARYFGEVFRMSFSDDEVYATFYQRLDAGIQLPDGDCWERLRAAADTLLFGEVQKREVRFAALTLDESGLTNYGDWLLFAKESMIAHRSTVFEENSVLFLRKHKVNAGNDYALPVGYRAPWEGRHRVVVSKLAEKLDSATSNGDLPKLVLSSGNDSEQDEFIEVHIWGPLTIRSFELVTGKNCSEPLAMHDQTVLQERFTHLNVVLELP